MHALTRLLLISLAPALIACSESVAIKSDAGPDGEVPGVFFEPAVACDAKESELYGDPGELPKARGAIMRCVDDGLISVSEIKKRLTALESDNRKNGDGSTNPTGVRNTYLGPAPAGGAHRYRVLYRTERGNGEPGYAVASIYLPDAPSTRKMPLVLLARGSRGQAAGCAVSSTTDGPVDLSDARDGRVVTGDFESMIWPLVASGLPVIATDSAGYANYGAAGNPPSGYADIGDMGKSFLDSAHALRRFLPDATTTDVVMVGLSQGGHTVLGSLQVANTYPAPGPIIGAAVYSPLWFAQRAWGIVLDPIAASFGGVVLNKSSGLPVSIWYHYTHAELQDGPGEGAKLFKPELRSLIKDFVDTTCWSSQYDKLAEAGRLVAADFFDPALIASVGVGAFARKCDDVADKPLCEKWLARYRADHPVLTGDAAKVPLLVVYGLKDNTIDSSRFQCAVDKLKLGDNPISYCIDPNANHGGSVLTQSGFVNEWLASKAFGTKITAKCPASAPPKSLECDPLLPND